MSWKIALVVALVSGIVTAVVTAPVADSVSGKMGVSDFEGKRGFAVVFLFIPAGFIGGALLGLLGTKLVHAVEWAHFWKAAGLSILLGQVGLFSIAGLCLLGLPRPPLIGGKELRLEVEVHVPLARITPRSREPQQIRMSLYAGPDDNNYLTVDTSTFSEEDGKLTMYRAQRKRVVYRDGDALVASGGGVEHRLELAAIPVTQNGPIGFLVENAMAAIAATWALGVDWATIRSGLAGFVNDAQTAPGRFNVFNYRGAMLIADYGHNPDAIQALVNAVDNLPLGPGSKRSVVISGAGDRRDEDIRRQTEILGSAFDRVVLYQDQCQRGRADGEVLALLQQGLQSTRRATDIQEIHGEFLAIDTALAELRAGDLCLILIDQSEEALDHIARRLAEG